MLTKRFFDYVKFLEDPAFQLLMQIVDMAVQGGDTTKSIAEYNAKPALLEHMGYLFQTIGFHAPNKFILEGAETRENLKKLGDALVALANIEYSTSSNTADWEVYSELYFPTLSLLLVYHNELGFNNPDLAMKTLLKLRDTKSFYLGL